jgi:hypothetical protein
MSALNQNPLTTNLATSLGFRFEIKRAPSLSYHCLSVKLPDVNLIPVQIPTPSLAVPYVGDHLEYSNLEATFKIDADMQNWLEMFNWIEALGNPTNKAEHYRALESRPSWSNFSLYSNLLLFQLDSQNNPLLIFTFEHASPIRLSGPKFQSTDSSEIFMSSTVEFKYLKFKVSTP